MKFKLNILLMFIISTSVLSKVQFLQPNQKIIKIIWDKNIESDLSHYILMVKEHGNDEYNNSITVIDTFTIVSIESDTIYAKIAAVDSDGNRSPFVEFYGDTEIIKLDYSFDTKNRIDLDDIREFLKLYYKNYGKTVTVEVK